MLNTFYPVIVKTNLTRNRPGNGASDDNEYLEESTAYEIFKAKDEKLTAD